MVNNASGINLAPTEQLEVKRFDLMQQINVQGAFVVTKACLPHLRQGTNPHILTLSPPVSLDPKWLGGHIGYTLAKYGMSLLALGGRRSFARSGSPRTLSGRERSSPRRRCRISLAVTRPCGAHGGPNYANAAHEILTRDSRACTVNTFLCEDVLVEAGLTDLSKYSLVEDAELAVDLDVDHIDPPELAAK